MWTATSRGRGGRCRASGASSIRSPIFWSRSSCMRALSHHLAAASGDAFYWALGAIAFLSCLLHCSYFVFYLVSYTSRVGSYAMNRVHETVTSADQKAKEAGALSGGSFFLQRLHGVLYGWQDSLIAILDRFQSQAGRGIALVRRSDGVVCRQTVSFAVESFVSVHQQHTAGGVLAARPAGVGLFCHHLSGQRLSCGFAILEGFQATGGSGMNRGQLRRTSAPRALRFFERVMISIFSRSNACSRSVRCITSCCSRMACFCSASRLSW